MRKIILNLAVSLDNYIEGPNGETDWLTFSEETGKVLHNYLKEIDTILYGRTSYEKWGTYVPEENAMDFEKDFYNATDKMAKYVFSKSIPDFKGSPIIVAANIAQRMQDLKKQSGKNIWLYGGAGLISTFMNLGLIDEFRLAICPIVLGKGKPLFKDLKDRTKLELLDVQSHTSGFLALTYRPLTD